MRCEEDGVQSANCDCADALFEVRVEIGKVAFHNGTFYV